MRRFRLLVLVALTGGVGAFACASFESASPVANEAATDAAIVDVAPAPVVEAEASSDATSPADAGPPDADAAVMPRGALVWEVHGAVGVGALEEAVGLAPNRLGGATVGLAFRDGVALGAQTLDAGPPLDAGASDAGGPRAAGVVAFDGANTIAWARVLPVHVVESVGVDRDGNTFVGGQHAYSEERVVPLVTGEAVLPPVRGDAGIAGTGFIARLRGSDGQPEWLSSLDPGPDAGAAGSITRSLAVRNDAVAVSASFIGTVSYPARDASASASQPVTANAQRDVVLLYLDRLDGELRWGRRLGGGGNQDVNAIGLDESLHVLGGGLSAGTVLLSSSDGGIALPPLTTFAAILFKIDGPGVAHPFLFARALDVTNANGSNATVATIIDLAEASNGDLIACGKLRNASAFEGKPIRSAIDDDAFVARFRPDGRELVWLKTYGEFQDEDCSSVAVGPGDSIAIALNYQSTGVKVDSIELPAPRAREWQSAHVMLDGAGNAVWVRAVSGGPNRTRRVAFSANGDLFAAGFFTGAVDLGAGPVSGPDRTFFLVRRSP